MTISTHLLRRGVAMAHSVHGMMSAAEPEEPSQPPKHIPFGAALVFFLTTLAFVCLLFSVGYTYGRLLPALCMIESPETAAYVPVQNMEPESTSPPAYSASTPAPKPSDEPTGDVDQLAVDGDAEVLLVRNKPITASIRQTILHLRARAGYWSRFRGLSMCIVWSLSAALLVSVLSGFSGNRLVVAVAAVVAETALATLHMAWVHIVISDPSPKRWYQRIPSIRTWPKIAPAVALWAASNQLMTVLPMFVCGSFGSMKHIQNPDYEPGRKDIYAVGAQGLMGAFLTLALFLLLEIPASVTLVRVAASMLPEEDETIVPFDRTFGGKTTPTILGGQGKIGLVEAWRSFPWASRLRLLKLMAKVAVIMIACWIFFTVVLVAEAHLMFGDKLGDVMKKMHGVGGPH